MHIFFWWDYYFKNFIFYGFNITSIGLLVATCLGLLVVAFLFEYVKMIQAKVRHKRLIVRQQQIRMLCPSESDTLLTEAGPSNQCVPPVITKRDRIIHFVSDLFLWLGQQMVGYGLMLTVMMYNGYMVVTIIFGAALGYFVFGPTMMKINLENCKAVRETFCMADCGDADKAALLRPAIVTENRAVESSPICHASTSTASSVISETAQASLS